VLLTSTPAGPLPLVLVSTSVTGPAGSVYTLRHRLEELRRADPTHAPHGVKEPAGTRVLAFSPAVAVLCDRRGGRGARHLLRPSKIRGRAESKVCFRDTETPRSLRSAARPPGRPARPRPGRPRRALLARGRPRRAQRPQEPRSATVPPHPRTAAPRPPTRPLRPLSASYKGSPCPLAYVAAHSN